MQKMAEFATSQMVQKPYFRRKSHVFLPTTLQILASNARAASSVPRYNALSLYHPNDIVRLATEAAELRKSSTLHLPVHYSPISISPAQPINSDSTELLHSLSSSQPISSEDFSSHSSINSPFLLPVVDATSTVCTSLPTSHNLSHLQDIRLKLSQTLNFQCALLQNMLLQHCLLPNNQCCSNCCHNKFYLSLLFHCSQQIQLRSPSVSQISIWVQVISKND